MSTRAATTNASAAVPPASRALPAANAEAGNCATADQRRPPDGAPAVPPFPANSDSTSSRSQVEGSSPLTRVQSSSPPVKNDPDKEPRWKQSTTWCQTVVRDRDRRGQCCLERCDRSRSADGADLAEALRWDYGRLISSVRQRHLGDAPGAALVAHSEKGTPDLRVPHESLGCGCA